jgi:two-component system LytT family response regulator
MTDLKIKPVPQILTNPLIPTYPPIGRRQLTRFIIPIHYRNEILNIQDVSHLEGCEKYTYIHLKNGRHVLSSYHIGKFKNILLSHGFYVTHKSFLINLDFIQSVTTNHEIIMKNGLKVPIARRRKTEFFNQFIN